MFFPLYYDGTSLFLMFISILLCVVSSLYVKITFKKYSKFVSNEFDGLKISQIILNDSNIHDVKIQYISGNLSDCYDPRKKILFLSDDTYNKNSIAALGVAAHECGHAIQHNKGYFFLKFRNFLYPSTAFASNLAFPLILIGCLFHSGSSNFFISCGIYCFAFSLIFQIVTLPVEFNASNKAIKILRNYMSEDNIKIVRKVLIAAALTYVAGLLVSILQLIRLLLLNRDNN